MSDLIEKVARAIRCKTDHGSEEQSRAAIAAVAEWLESDGAAVYGVAAAKLRAAGDGR